MSPLILNFDSKDFCLYQVCHYGDFNFFFLLKKEMCTSPKTLNSNVNLKLDFVSHQFKRQSFFNEEERVDLLSTTFQSFS